MADRFPLILNTNANQIQELPLGDTLDLNGAVIRSSSFVGTGVSIVGVVTATSFSGSGANLSNLNITSLNDSGGNAKIEAEASGAVYTGIHTFGSTTSFTSGVFNGTVTALGVVINGDIDLNGDIDVDGHTNLDNVSVGGATTFTGAIDANGDLDVDGHTNLDNVNVAGVTTFAGAIDLNADLDVDGHINLDNVNVAGVSTFSGAIDLNADLDVDGHTNLDNVNVAGVTTFAGTVNTASIVSTGIDLNGDIDVDGHTNLDNVNVAGVTTFAGAISGSSAAFTGNVSVGGVLTYEDVKNVDSVGVATARVGLKVLAGGANVVGVVTASNGIFVPDSQTIHLGNASGSGDLRLYHDGSNSYIEDAGTGQLNIKGNQINIKNTDDNLMLVASGGGAVNLYYNGSTKLATSNTGVTITGTAVATTFSGSGASLTNLPAGNLTGTLPAISGANLTSLPAQATIANNADNRVITGGSGVNLNGEERLTFDGNSLQFNTTANNHGITNIATGNHYTLLKFDSNRSAANDVLSIIDFKWNGNTVADILCVAGSDSSNKDDGQLKFRTSPSQGSISERVRIEQNGQIGVGGISPRTINSHAPQIQISGNNYSDATVSIINNANSSNGAYLFLGKQRSGSANGNTIVQSNDIIGQIRFNGADGTDLENPMAYIECRVDGTPGSNDMPGRLVFYTTPDGSGSPQVRMTIKNNGRVGINESDPSEMLYVAGNIYATGNVTAYSDIRVKENVKEISNALEAVDKIRGVSYTRKDTKEDTLGVSAQEVESMFPELVVEDNHGMKSVNYNGLIGVLFSAVKELSTKLKHIEDK